MPHSAEGGFGYFGVFGGGGEVAGGGAGVACPPPSRVPSPGTAFPQSLTRVMLAI